MTRLSSSIRHESLKKLHVGIVAAAGASAFGLGFWQSTEDRTAIQDAIANNDFTAWKTAVTATLTEDNFNKMVERHNNMVQRRENMDEMRTAIDAGDYDSYIEAVGNMDNLPDDFQPLSEEDFNLLVQIHEARQSGDYETAQQLRDQLSNPMIGGFGRGMMGEGFGHAGGMEHGFNKGG